MTPQEICSHFIESNKRILHIGCGDKSLKKYANASQYIGVGLDQNADLCIDVNVDSKNLPGGWDYVIFDEILEVVEDPASLLLASKNLGEKVLVYEYKHNEPEDFCKDHWKKPWTRIGLEHILTQNFDYVNTILLGYATIYICSYPYTPSGENLDD